MGQGAGPSFHTMLPVRPLATLGQHSHNVDGTSTGDSGPGSHRDAAGTSTSVFAHTQPVGPCFIPAPRLNYPTVRFGPVTTTVTAVLLHFSQRHRLAHALRHRLHSTLKPPYNSTGRQEVKPALGSVASQFWGWSPLRGAPFWELASSCLGRSSRVAHSCTLATEHVFDETAHTPSLTERVPATQC